MLKELKEDVEKVKKMMYEQNGKNNKEIEKLKSNSRTFSSIIIIKTILVQLQ